MAHSDSSASLKSMLIMPQTPTPEPLEVRDPRTLTFNDIAKLQRQVKAQNNTPASVKTERDQMPNIHKRARLSPGASKVKRDNGIDVHDLTSDELPHKGKVVIVID
jgi:hypothetical protein